MAPSRATWQVPRGQLRQALRFIERNGMPSPGVESQTFRSPALLLGEKEKLPYAMTKVIFMANALGIGGFAVEEVAMEERSDGKTQFLLKYRAQNAAEREKQEAFIAKLLQQQALDNEPTGVMGGERQYSLEEG